MDTTVLRRYSFLSIPSAVRDIEHKYTKTQHLSYKELSDYGIEDREVKTMKQAVALDNLVIITNDGNFFDFELPVDYNRNTPYRIHNIQIVRPNFDDGPDYISDVPAGTEIKIRFTYEEDPTNGGAGDYTTRIYLWQSTAHDTAIPPRKIKSSYADTNGGEYITILHNLGSTNLAETNEKIAGDIITFTKGGDDFWYVTNVNREKQLLKSITSTVTWYSLSSAIMIPKSPVKRIESFGGGYRWVDDNSISLTWALPTPSQNSLDHPFKQEYGSGFTFTDGVGMPGFLIGKNSIGIVYLKGSFRLTMPATSLNKNYQFGLGNKFHIANITDTTWYVQVAQDDTAIETTIHYTRWGYCEVIVRSDNANGMPLSQGSGAIVLPGRILVDTSGRIFLHFQLNFFAGLNSLLGTYTIDVNVPEFSYSTT
jgi:hypothetical protein